MTNKIFTKIIRAVAFAVIAFSLVVSAALPAFAQRGPDLVTQSNTPIALDRADPITLYFQYGSTSNDLDIVNATASLSISSPSLQFVTSGFDDLYLGNPERPDTENPPAQATCSSAYSGPVYRINPSLATASSLAAYGLQSARNPNAPSGATTVDRLREKHTGCIRARLLVSPEAEEGDVVDVIFDQDSANSVTYQAVNRPVRQVVRFTIGPATGASSSSASSISVTQSSSISQPDPVSSAPVVSSVSSAPIVTTGGGTQPINPPATVNSTPRSGGFEIAAGLAVAATAFGGYTAYKMRKNRQIKSVDIGNSSAKKRK